ncbi:MAG: hypothetical protein IKC69_02790 [Clostridia bacterium]|nr:hypothetical protein [Clostridia bacterium]
MKRLIALILAMVSLLSLVACGTEEASTATADRAEATAAPPLPQSKTKEETKEKQEEKATLEEILPHIPVNDPLTRERLEAIPIANASMSIDELRQICVDFFILQVTFTWTPKSAVQYTVDSNGHPVQYRVGGLYGGIPYVNLGSCSLYRVLEQYDEKTGVWDVSLLEKKPALMGNACSSSAGLAWGRVVNSSTLFYTSGYTPKAGFLPLGPYESNYEISTFGTNSENDNPKLIDVKDILALNDTQTMYESYALLKPADGIVSGGHVRMAREAAVVVRNEDGTINGEESYCIFVEQGCYNSDAAHTRTQADGASYQIQGNDNLKVSFRELVKGYLPFTFAEFLGTDPVEKSEVKMSLEEKDLTVAALTGVTVTSNYIVTDAYCVLLDRDGNEIFCYVLRQPRHCIKKFPLKNLLPTSVFAQYEGKAETIRLSARLSTGEKIVFYEGRFLNDAY